MPKNKFIELSWREVRPRLSSALRSYTDVAAENVKSGFERAFMINHRSFCLLRAEKKELVVVGFVGQIDDVLPIKDRAVELGFETVRIHTDRPGMLKKLKNLGLVFSEIEQRENPDFKQPERLLRMVF